LCPFTKRCHAPTVASTTTTTNNNNNNHNNSSTSNSTSNSGHYTGDNTSPYAIDIPQTAVAGSLWGHLDESTPGKLSADTFRGLQE
jgi:hypothetical protein